MGRIRKVIDKSSSQKMDQLDKLKQQELHIFHSLVGKVAEKDAQVHYIDIAQLHV
jgi:hypothetical protein